MASMTSIGRKRSVEGRKASWCTCSMSMRVHNQLNKNVKKERGQKLKYRHKQGEEHGHSRFCHGLSFPVQMFGRVDRLYDVKQWHEWRWGLGEVESGGPCIDSVRPGRLVFWIFRHGNNVNYPTDYHYHTTYSPKGFPANCTSDPKYCEVVNTSFMIASAPNKNAPAGSIHRKFPFGHLVGSPMTMSLQHVRLGDIYSQKAIVKTW